MRYFFDTSAIAKLFHVEKGTPQVISIFRQPERQIIISRLTLVELFSVAAIKFRTGEISNEARQSYVRQVLVTIALGEILVMASQSEDFDQAARLITNHGHLGLRTLDAIQLAAALRQNTQASLDYFVCADQRLASIARLVQLRTIEPSDSDT